VKDVLKNDGALIELFGDEVGGAAGDAGAGFEGLAVGGSAGEEGKEGWVNVDDAGGEGVDDFGGEDLHVAGEDDDVGLEFAEAFEESGHVGGFLVGRGAREIFKRDVGGFGEVFEGGVVGEDGDDLTVEFGGGGKFEECFEAVRFFAGEDDDAFGAWLALQSDFDFHVNFFAEVQCAGDEFIEGDGHVFEVDEHIHDEKAGDDALFEVLDVDAAIGDEGGELGDDAFLVAALDGENGEDFVRHAWSCSSYFPTGGRA